MEGPGLHGAGLSCRGPAALPAGPGSLSNRPSSHSALAHRPGRCCMAFTRRSTFTHSLQSQMPRLYSNQNGSPNKLNEGGTAITVWITVSDAFVPQIKNIAEVRHPHFSCLSSEIAHCTLKHRKVIWSVFLQKWPRPNLSRALSTEIVGNWTGSVRNTFPLEYVSVIPNEPRPQLYLMFSGFLSEFALWVHCGGFNLFCQRGKYVFVSFNRKCGPKRFFL